jgi:SAM-dependent methyltransferase
VLPDDVPAPRLYAELASFWPLLSPPAPYVDELPELSTLLDGRAPAHTLLELGSGGGSVAFHLKERFAVTLSDRSPEMLAVSRAVNPQCEHVLGDMRTLRLGRTFDRVLIHDAIMYACSRGAVAETLATAALHCRPGGTLVVLPDCVRETFAPSTSQGGEDGPDGRGLRYLEWRFDPDPTDETYDVAYAFLLRHADGSVTTEGDRHRLGLFPRAFWLEALRAAGFAPRAVEDSFGRTVFVGERLPADV